jgi:DNA-binding transcriptional ArsR family regulator
VTLDARGRLEALEAVFAALAHPSRRQILMTVHFRNGMTSGEIADRFHHAWPTISRHLGILEDAGLLVAERQGRTRVYRVDHERLAVIPEWMKWFEAKPGAGKRLPR